MQGGMLHTAIVPVNRHPVVEGFLACKCLIIMRVDIAEEVPGRACPLWHGVRLPLCGSTATRTGGINPVGLQG